MNTEENNDHPFRTIPLDMVPVASYNKLATELEHANARIKKLESRNSLHEGVLSFFHRLPRLVLCVCLVAAGVYVIHWAGFKGTTHGARSRQIAETEAMRYASRRFGPVQSVVCESSDLELLCWVRMVDPGVRAPKLVCDSDEPEFNDGCEVHKP
jgi:hypothetical protein